MKVTLSNGMVLNFPDSMSQEEIKSAIDRNFGAQEEKQPESLKDKIIKYGVRAPITGLANLGHGLLNTPYNVTRGLENLGNELGAQYAQAMPGIFQEPEQQSRKRLSDYIPRQENYDFRQMLGGQGQPDTGEQLTSFLTQNVPAFLLPGVRLGAVSRAAESIPVAGKYVAGALEQAAPQAAFAATQSEDPFTSGAEAGATMLPFALAGELTKSASPKVRAIAKTIGASLGGMAGKEAASSLGFGDSGQTLAAIIGATLGGRGMQTRKSMIQGSIEGIDPEIAAERIAAAKRLKLDYLTPAEASLSPAVAERQGRLGKTPEGSALMYERGMSRVGSEENAIQRLLDTIYQEPIHGEMKRAAYNTVSGIKLGDEFATKHANNEIVKQAQKIVESNPAYKEELKTIGNDSVGYWDLIKRAMDDMAEKAPKAEQRLIRKATTKLRDAIKDEAPAYSDALALSRREIIRNQIEEKFNKKPMTGINMFKVLEDKSKYEKLINSLHDVPQAQSMLKDMRLIFKDLINPPSVRTAAQLKRTSMTEARNAVQSLEDLAKNIFTGGKHEKAVVDFIMSPTWPEALQKLDQIPVSAAQKQVLLGKLINMTGKPISQYAAQD